MGQKLCCLRPSTSEKRAEINAPDYGLLHVKSFTTLEDCLINSPLNSGSNIKGGEIIQVSKNPSKRVYPSSPDFNNTMFYTPRMSFSSVGKLEKIDELGESSISRSRSGKLKRKVTFKLPEEADVIIFYSPKETLDGTGDS